jgi:AmmeMemoRadiSam system protein B
MIEYPKLRHVDVFPVKTEDGDMYALRDPSGIADDVVVLSPPALYLLRFFDGQHSRLDIRAQFSRAFGQLLFENQLDDLIRQLDEHFLLESEAYFARRRSVEEDFRAAPTRSACHAGNSYPADPDELRRTLDGYFEAPEGAGKPAVRTDQQPTPRALVAPHIDLRLGGPCYSHAYRALLESEPADCYVIIGTGHNGLAGLYAALDKDFETPLGLARCDRDFLRLLAERYDGDLFNDILLHKTEHTVEFQVVFLQHLLGGHRDFAIVPLLSSFSYHFIDSEQFPREAETIERFTAALRETIQQYQRRVCLIASVDLSHVGPRYGDPQAVDASFLTQVGAADREALEAVEALDPGRFYSVVRRNQDRYRMCGFSPLYTLLKTVQAERGRLLHYSKAAMDGTGSYVTFASMAVY